MEYAGGVPQANEQKQPLRVVELFAGIGGFGLALTRSGHKIVYANEWEEYASNIYKRHFGPVDRRDIRTVPASQIPDHDLLCGGFPCPDFSDAGRQRGYEGDEGKLFFEIIRIAREKRPKYLLLENVKGFLKFKERALREIEELGYEYEYALLNSLAFGVAQNRERVYIFCIRRDCCTDTQQVQRLQGDLGAYLHRLCADLENAKGGWAYPRHSKQGWSITKDETGRGGTTARVPHWVDRMRCLGNAVTVNVVEAIVRQLPL